MTARLPAVPTSPVLSEVLTEMFAHPQPERVDSALLGAWLQLSQDSADSYVDCFAMLGLIDDNGIPTQLYCGLREDSKQAPVILARQLLDVYSRLFERISNAHRLSEVDLRAQCAQILGVHLEHASVPACATTFGALVDYVGHDNLDEALNQRLKPKHRDPLLVLAAKFTGLGLVVLLLSAVFELLTGEALSYDMFRNGVGFAYGAAVSIIIAFSKREAKLANDAVKALIFTICGIMIWMLIDLHVRPFEVVSAFAGVWYAVLVRRL